MQKVVYKYGTGQPIPEGAVYLSTQVETKTEHQEGSKGDALSFTTNRLVWHYFLVEIPDGECKHCAGKGCRACDARKL